MVDRRCIVTFSTTHDALCAERVALEAGIPAKMIPVPRQLSADCNMGMEAPPEHGESLGALLEAAGVECSVVMWPR